jgi:hypothetical protein
LINTDAINVCNNDDFIASDREGIGWTPTFTPGAEGESSSLAEMHSRSPHLLN